MKTHIKKLTLLFFLIASTTFFFSCSSDDDDPLDRAHDWEELTASDLKNNGEYYHASLNRNVTVLESAISNDTYNMFDPENGVQTTDYIAQIMEHYNISKEDIIIYCEYDGGNPPTLIYCVAFGDTIIFKQRPYEDVDQKTNVYSDMKRMEVRFYNKITKLNDVIDLTNYKIMKKVVYIDGQKTTQYKTTFTSKYNVNGREKIVNWSFYTP